MRLKDVLEHGVLPVIKVEYQVLEHEWNLRNNIAHVHFHTFSHHVIDRHNVSMLSGLHRKDSLWEMKSSTCSSAWLYTVKHHNTQHCIQVGGRRNKRVDISLIS